MSDPLPDDVERAIRHQEERLTRELQETTGRGDLRVEYDRTPLLIPEAIEPPDEDDDLDEEFVRHTIELLMEPIGEPVMGSRKWPDDFRGFGSNVRPKKQK